MGEIEQLRIIRPMLIVVDIYSVEGLSQSKRLKKKRKLMLINTNFLFIHIIGLSYLRSSNTIEITCIKKSSHITKHH